MKKFTFLAEYCGGTYITQYLATSIKKAIHMWASDLDFSSRQKQIIAKEACRDVVKVKKLSDVFCFSLLVDKHLLLVHVVNN